MEKQYHNTIIQYISASFCLIQQTHIELESMKRKINWNYICAP